MSVRLPTPVVRLAASALVAGAVACVGGEVQDTTLGLAVDTVDLGPVWLGDQRRTSLVVRSTGTGAVRVLEVTTTHPELAIETVVPEGGHLLASAEALPVALVWTPAVAGPLAAVVEVRTDVPGSERVSALVTGTASVAPDCDDANPCTDDAFDRNAGACLRTPHDRGCDDGSACTGGDRCRSGSCLGEALRCDDDDTCTLDLCDPARGCLFPPDDRVCADADPCTADVCHRTDGCTHPPAPDGTACGTFSCDLAHLCVLGDCRTLDVTGASDGFPCFDGDLCTEGDLCAAGACAPGPRVRSEPEVVATLPTYGGAGARVATDGFRYLFADRWATHVGWRNGAVGELRHGGSLPLGSDVWPAFVAPGRFALAVGNRLVLVETLVFGTPVVRWEHEVVPVSDASPDPRIVELVAVRGGLVAVVEGTPDEGDRRAWFVPLDPISHTPGSPRPLPLGAGLRHLDSDGAHLVASGPGGTRWFALGAPGEIARMVDVLPLLPSPTGPLEAVRVDGAFVAVRTSARIDLFELDPEAGQPVRCVGTLDPAIPQECLVLEPSASGSFPFPPGAYLGCAATSAGCPDGRECVLVRARVCRDCHACDDGGCGDQDVGLCLTTGSHAHRGSVGPSNVGDVALLDGKVHWSDWDGIYELPTAALGAGVVLEPERIDTYGAPSLRRGEGHLLAFGMLALPLARTAAGWRRITGPGHGSVSAVTDSSVGGRVRVGGLTAVGEIDLLSKRIASWSLATALDEPGRALLLRGARRTVVVQPFAANTRDLALQCRGEQLRILESDGTETERPICGLFPSVIEPNGPELWASGAVEEDLRDTPPAEGTRAWHWDRPSTGPIRTLEEGVTDGWQRRLRSEDAGPLLAATLRSEALGGVRTQLLRDGALVGELLLTDDLPAPRDRNGLATDGIHALLVGRTALLFHAFAVPGSGPPAAPLATLSLPELTGGFDVSIPWMARGRSWVAASGPFSTRDVSSLLELSYAAAPPKLTSVGTVPLPAEARGLFDTGVYAVVATDAGIVVVAPACR